MTFSELLSNWRYSLQREKGLLVIIKNKMPVDVAAPYCTHASNE